MTTPSDAGAGFDARIMAAALRLSRRHVGLTADNPSVGCLIVQGTGKNARIVGRGVTALGGRPHAERVALAEAGDAARGAVAYVTLEPCAHHGRTGPCAVALAQAGIAAVAIGADDPDPRVDGRGRIILHAAGVVVHDLMAEPEGTRAFEGFLSRIRRGRPFVTLKMAVSRDGFIGRRGEGQIAISGAVSNRQTHGVRAEMDAILVGIGTALADDPALTCRLPGLKSRSPARIVIDPRLRLPPDGQLARTARDVSVIVATAVDPDGDAAKALRSQGCRLLPLTAGEGALRSLLEALSRLGISTLLVEGGAETASRFLREGLVDRVVLVRGAVTLGGRGVAAPPEVRHLNGFRASRTERFGGDRWTEYERIEA
ncbi:bifunctional diaminohydroxyphosphoribosylaminopyrimidine deaminase/5-amino-6-(5-phosphoribosylamino)uracil reductase RibD [Aureimonas pseudogalii]|uniref:Riboflavin biosynthesis protein RibD n=1 Tax=Aureimonas pseudogalii TaxID=1744844 RepID=A0A7W6EEJ1_9HYPH|nr:bifunctional diaminohydroxyphosphoribosylaminopyrimidine deaminase/5-amino-6-(5-phosphoribosylamino)uracil reductase RibD [Aureimonas pseudogalii]MBB3998606.1 diaminohydroxyphosphoribosylaminopyrimidine deaminase/5-amino-6-(5-phosphoribosylamino)uracil reductase [Aureimonas pseudogalii]